MSLMLLMLTACFDLAGAPAVAAGPAPTEVDTGTEPVPDTGVACRDIDRFR